MIAQRHGNSLRKIAFFVLGAGLLLAVSLWAYAASSVKAMNSRCYEIAADDSKERVIELLGSPTRIVEGEERIRQRDHHRVFVDSEGTDDGFQFVYSKRTFFVSLVWVIVFSREGRVCAVFSLN
jgi:hypothetical protein